MVEPLSSYCDEAIVMKRWWSHCDEAIVKRSPGGVPGAGRSVSRDRSAREFYTVLKDHLLYALFFAALCAPRAPRPLHGFEPRRRQDQN